MITTVVDDNAQTCGQIRQVFIQPYCPSSPITGARGRPYSKQTANKDQ